MYGVLETVRCQEQKSMAGGGETGKKFTLPLFPERRRKSKRRRLREEGWREEACEVET